MGRFLEVFDHQVGVETFKISNADGTLAATESNLHLWYSQVANRDTKDVNRFGENKGESEKMFSLWLYYWMIDHESLATNDLESRLYIDGMTYLAERVFELPYNELKLHFTDEEIYGVGFGDKGVLNICRDGVDLRRAEQESTNRVMHEGLGMWNLVQLLQTLKVGESAMLISPPDPDDPNMGGYNLIYLYEKTSENNLRMGVITDNVNDIEYWRNNASTFSRYRNDFSQYDHNQFVAHPFITKQSLVEIKSTILHTDDKYVPDWALEKLRKVIPSVRKALYEGNVKRAEELFNAFKIATTAKLLNKDKDVNMERLVDDIEYFMVISGWYIHNGGDKYINKKTGCSLDRINLGDRDLFNNQWDRYTKFDMNSVGTDKPEDETYSFDIRGKCVGSCFDEVLEDGTKVKHERDLGPCHLCRECDAEAKKNSQTS
ncbi:hypothetical protein KBD69_01200 [Candidatus Woesebacteria bacterium]|nr:hypothetical protein [Candidatus Woesebacteria bacterium]